MADRTSRAGRIKGVNRRTQFLEARAKAAHAVPVLDAAKSGKITLSSFDRIAESLTVMGECLGVFLEHARSFDKDDATQAAERLEAYDHVLHAAAMLAPYRYPKFATVTRRNSSGNVRRAQIDAIGISR